jgi:hypothetical protein
MELNSFDLEMAKKSNRVEEIVLAIADRLVHDGNMIVYYNNHEFYFQEVEYANPMDFSSMTMIGLNTPKYISRDMDFRCGVTYDSTYGKNSKTAYLNRSKACMELAKQFVYKVLPKVDFEIKKEVNNMEIEEILEVLE